MTSDPGRWLLAAAIVLAAGGAYSLWQRDSAVLAPEIPDPPMAVRPAVAPDVSTLPQPTPIPSGNPVPPTLANPVLADADGVLRSVQYRRGVDSGVADALPAASDFDARAQAVLAQMRSAPQAFADKHELELEDVQAIADGRKPLPVGLVQ